MTTGTKPGWYPGRCKDCASTDLVTTARCAECAAAHAAREKARRAERRAAQRCTVCGLPAARAAGAPLTTCKRHREYYRARAARDHG